MRFFLHFFIVCYVYLFDFVWYLQLYDPITNYLVLQQPAQVFQLKVEEEGKTNKITTICSKRKND